VVQLNVVKTIRLILDVITEVHARSSCPPDPASSTHDLSQSPTPHSPRPTLTAEQLRLKTRLLPLLQVEELLIRRLTHPGSAEFEPTHLGLLTNLPYSSHTRTTLKEVSVNSSTEWKGAFGRLLSRTSSSEGAHNNEAHDPNDPGIILHACSEDMIQLWNDPTIKSLLRARKLRLEDMAGLWVILCSFLV